MYSPLPHDPLRRRVLTLFAGSAALTGGVALLLARTLQMGAAYPAKAVLVFVAIGGVVLGWLEGNHPFPTFGAANGVTTLRASLVTLVAALVGEPRTDAVALVATAAALLASALDGVDGWIARRTGTISDFGARYDMETDALLILALSTLAWQHAQAGWWILLAGLMRYAFVAAGYSWPWMAVELPPSVRRKTVCVVQVLGLAAVVSPLFTPPASVVIAALTLASLVYSFAVDLLWLRRHAI